MTPRHRRRSPGNSDSLRPEQRQVYPQGHPFRVSGTQAAKGHPVLASCAQEHLRHVRTSHARCDATPRSEHCTGLVRPHRGPRCGGADDACCVHDEAGRGYLLCGHRTRRYRGGSLALICMVLAAKPHGGQRHDMGRLVGRLSSRCVLFGGPSMIVCILHVLSAFSIATPVAKMSVQ